ncbi:hypothetical protein EST62_12740 [Chlorobaculum sp. 24CR]|uniref:hypothetical protein n=1 Tax=Chlorobaculum sp. 24CR TaxID=2508878 RepID=UPI00100AFD37|nr:hypothetical protein [Chlorobaculum sp. 24CR]RXK80336.1 hypothetical protein EST62_12740 [Chlorobaculum sp. 24CR]
MKKSSKRRFGDTKFPNGMPKNYDADADGDNQHVPAWHCVRAIRQAPLQKHRATSTFDADPDIDRIEIL